VADGVNVDFDVYRIRTQITEQGSTVDAGYHVDYRDRQTRKLRWEQLDEDLSYSPNQLDRDVVAEDQIRTVVRAFRDRLFTDIFPGRTDVPKTIIFAKDDRHADDIVEVVRREFGKGNDFCQKITDKTTDTVSADSLIEAGFSAGAADHARSLIESFQQFIEQNRDEIAALQVLYNRPYRQRLTYPDIKALADALQLPPRSWTPDRLWQAYQQLDRSKVRGSGQRVLADMVSLVRFAVGEDDELVPFAEQVKQRFEGWMAMQETAGRAFTSEQRLWLEAIRDHIAGSVSIGLEDFQFAPFDQRGGVARAYALFGDDLAQVLEELNAELVA
jgi:type I site-specific restriction endonuclease